MNKPGKVTESEQNIILVTAIGTINGGPVVDELRKIRGRNVKIIGTNTTSADMVVTSKYVDEFYEFPSVPEMRESYLDYLLDFCKMHQVTHIICFIDEEVELLSRNKALFAQAGIHVCVPDYPMVNICHFKNHFSRWIEENIPEIWIREYRDLDAIRPEDYPLFAKPIEGRGSRGCCEIRDQKGLEDYIQKAGDRGTYLVQEMASGTVVSVDVVRNRKYNQIEMIQKKENMRNSNGCGTAVEIIHDSDLDRICRLLAEKLDLNGLMNAEFFMTEAGPKVIEINPRLPAGTAFSVLAGGNTVINTILIAEGQRCEFEKIRVGAKYARRYETYEM